MFAFLAVSVITLTQDQVFLIDCNINLFVFFFGSGSHVLQRISGCEWDDKSGEIKIFEKWGYEGEDIISLDQQTMTWITSKAEAVAIKHLWDADTARFEIIKDYFMLKVPKLLQGYIYCVGTVYHRTGRDGKASC